VKRANLWRIVTVVFVWLVLLSHFGSLWLLAAPSNALDQTFAQALAVYRGSVFAQHWAFFAPDPPRGSLAVYARRELPDGGSTAWVNVTRSLSSGAVNNSLSPQQPVFEALTHAASDCSRAISSLRYPCGRSWLSWLILKRTCQAVLNRTFGRNDGARIKVQLVKIVYAAYQSPSEADTSSIILVSGWESVGPVATL
jgi:hypothetical protein